MARPATLARLAAAALLLPALSATPQTASSPRVDLEAVASALDRAVREAGAPGIATIGGSLTRAYLLPGGGAMFVLPPRALPSGRRKVDVGARSVRALREAMAHLQDTLSRVREPEMRAQIQRSVEALRRAQAELQRVKPVVPPLPPLAPPPPPPGQGPVVLGVPDAEELATAIEEHVARQMRAFDQAQRAQGAAWQRQWEAQVRALTEQSDAFRREAQRAQEEAERALQEQLAAWPALAGEPPAAAPSLPPEPAPPAAAAPPAPPAAPAPPAPPAVAAPAAPWSLWLDLDLDEGEPADAEGHVARVREAVLGVLEAEAPRLARLATEGSVAVAVDFVPRGPLPRRVSRTLVLRVPRKDLADRAAGRLSGGEFRRRVTASDY
jgi:hypothetical protein